MSAVGLRGTDRGAWETATLGDVCRFMSGGTPSKQKPEYWQGAIPWVSPKDMKRPRLFDVPDHISDVALENGSALAPAGSVFVVVRGMVLAKDVPVALAQRAMAFNQDVKALVPGPRIDSEFLLYALLASKRRLRERVGRSAHGTATLMSDDLAQCSIVLPPLDEQRRIAEVVRTAQQAIEHQQQLLALTGELKRALLTKLFSEGTRGGPQQQSEIGAIPARWTLRGLGDLARVKGGKRLPKGEPFAPSRTPFPYIRVTDFADQSVDVSDLKYLRPETQAAIRRYTITPRDVFISIAGSIGIVGMISDELDGANLTENAAKLELTSDDILPRFLMYFLSGPAAQREIKAQTLKNAQPKLALARIAALHVPIPPIDEQRGIVDILDAAADKARIHRSTLHSYGDLFRTLLHQLMTAQLRVHDLDLAALDTAVAA